MVAKRFGCLGDTVVIEDFLLRSNLCGTPLRRPNRQCCSSLTAITNRPTTATKGRTPCGMGRHSSSALVTRVTSTRSRRAFVQPALDGLGVSTQGFGLPVSRSHDRWRHCEGRGVQRPVRRSEAQTYMRLLDGRPLRILDAWHQRGARPERLTGNPVPPFPCVVSKRSITPSIQERACRISRNRQKPRHPTPTSRDHSRPRAPSGLPGATITVTSPRGRSTE